MSHEASYIKAALLDPSVLHLHPVSEDWFTGGMHRKAHAILRDLAECDGVDPDRFWAIWQSQGHSLARYNELLDSAAGIVAWAVAGLSEAHERRTLAGIIQRASLSVQDPLVRPEDVRAEILAGVSGMASSASCQTITDVLNETETRLEEIRARGGVSGLETGFMLLDRILGGWERDKLYSVGARPKSGKTALAVQTAVEALRQGARVYFASREMGSVQLGMRLLSQTGRVDGNALRRAGLSEGDQRRLDGASSLLRQYGTKFVVDTRASLPWESLRAAILQAHAHDPVGLVLLDYVQLVSTRDREENRAAELERIVYGLKELAKELRAPVVALSQLNRDQDEGKPPSSSKLKGSGGIEQAADVSILLWRPNVNDQRTIEVVVDLNRDGPTGKFRAAFRPEWTLFE